MTHVAIQRWDPGEGHTRPYKMPDRGSWQCNLPKCKQIQQNLPCPVPPEGTGE